MKRIFIAVAFSLSLTSPLFADNVGLLPRSFAGWTETGPARTTSDAAQADAAYPAVLKEYGFVSSETVTYTRDEDRTHWDQSRLGQPAHSFLPRQRPDRRELRPAHGNVCCRTA